MKKIFTLAATFILLISLALVGCSNQSAAKAPQEALKEAYTKSSEITSSKFDGSMKMSLELPESALEDPSAAMVLDMLNNAELTFRGTSQLDPMMAELFITARVTGDTEMAINLSMLITEEKMWIKVPSTPFLPLPAEVVGKYLEIDFAELAELSGEEIAINTELQARYQELGIEIMDLFFGAYEEDEYFSNVSKEDAGVPGDVDANQVVKFEITNENLRPFVETFIEILPDLLDKLSEVEEAGITQEDIDMLKADLAASEADIAATLDEIESMVNINDANIITALDKNGYITYMDFNVNADITSEGETGTIGFDIAMKQSAINEEPEFEITEPAATETVSLEELMNTLMGSGY